jgi:imidazolonepropionase-like amidohydrolase
VGALAWGLGADVVVWSGDPFEPLTRVRHVFIAGREIPLRSRQTELRDRYRSLDGARPRP